MTYSKFMAGANHRQRYWARSFLGYPHISSAQPNDGHRALAHWEQAGRVTHIITQNVDSLHIKAGSAHVTELHGSLAEVVCLQCRRLSARSELQQRFNALNQHWLQNLQPALQQRLLNGTLGDKAAVGNPSNPVALLHGSTSSRDADAAALRPDGDVELNEDSTAQFQVPACDSCGGILKPRVVFFGENVPLDTVQHALKQVTAADLLLVLGSSLHVWSGRRFVSTAVNHKIPVAIVNWGPTRADDLATVRVHDRIVPVLAQLSRFLGVGTTSGAAAGSLHAESAG